MGNVYHRFSRDDLLSTTVYTKPYLSFTSGTAGWRSTVGISSSLSLYEGIRSRRDVSSGLNSIELYPLDPLDTHSIDKVIFVSGSYPATGSVHFVKARRVASDSFFDITHDDWYEKHFNPVTALFDFHKQFNPEFFTGSYDYYCLRFKQNLSHYASCVDFSSSFSEVTSSYTFEARVKPTEISGSHDRVIMSQGGRWKLFITSGSGKLAYSDYTTTITSSSPLTNGIWQHVGVSVGQNSASLYIDGRVNTSINYTTVLPSSTSTLAVGAEVVQSSSFLRYDNGFDGFIYETRVWGNKRTPTNVSSSAFMTLIGDMSSSNILKHYARFNDGPLSTKHGFSKGSGTFDHSQYSVHGYFNNFGSILPLTPIWHKNDDHKFTTLKTRIDDQIDYYRILHVPAMFYGRQLASGSVRLECRSYYDQSIRRVLLDDGRGCLYISGSITKDISNEEYKGVHWNKVGNVFYGEGLVVITEPSLMEFGDINRDPSGSDTLLAEFRGDVRIPSKVLMCRLDMAEANGSNNKTWSYLDDRGDDDPSNDRFIRTRPDNTTYITTVGLYNEFRELVAVAKLAQPIRKREKDKLNIKLKMDF